MLMGAGLFVVMRWLFNVPIAGTVSGLMFATFLYVFCLLSLGLLISTKAQNQIQALQMSMIFILPSVFFSGFIFPRETMPAIFYAIGSVLPATYYIELERAIVLRGASLQDFWINIILLAAMGLALFSLCALRFKQKVA
jgi:drug efflux transport system permease protein